MRLALHVTTATVLKLNRLCSAQVSARGRHLGIPDSLFDSSVVSQTSNQFCSPVKSHLEKTVTHLHLSKSGVPSAAGSLAQGLAYQHQACLVMGFCEAGDRHTWSSRMLWSIWTSRGMSPAVRHPARLASSTAIARRTVRRMMRRSFPAAVGPGVPLCKAFSTSIKFWSPPVSLRVADKLAGAASYGHASSARHMDRSAVPE